MSARLLDGHAVAAAIREAVLPGRPARSPRRRAGRPGSASSSSAIDPSSEIYVRNKVKAGAETGLWVDLQRLPATATPRRAAGRGRAPERQRRARRHPGAGAVACGDGEARGASRVRRHRPGARTSTDFIRSMSGVLVQGRPHLVPCTPSGVIVHARALRHRDCAVARSGASAAATSSASRWRCCCCARTPRSRSATRGRRILPAVAREADILVAAIGRAGFVTPSFVKPGATVIDVGINRVTDRATSHGRFSMRGPHGSQISSDGDPSSSETCTRRSPRLPGR